MKWTWKALLQIGVSTLPRFLGDPLYYFLQRRLGRLQALDPFSRFEAGAQMARMMEQHGQAVEGRKILEIGTGWRLNTPLALWLLGADVVTVDLNTFLKPELILEDIRQLAAEGERVQTVLGGRWQQQRWEILTAIGRGKLGLSALVGIEYLAPKDASRLSEFADETFDGSVSYAVLEHIPPHLLSTIFIEVARVTHRQGTSVHFVDHSDHFWQTDPSITSVNFLRYSPTAWKFWGGNRFAYCNRLRSSEVAQIFRETGYDIVEIEPRLDEEVAFKIVEDQLPLWGHFAEMPAEEVALLDTWYVLRRNR